MRCKREKLRQNLANISAHLRLNVCVCVSSVFVVSYPDLLRPPSYRLHFINIPHFSLFGHLRTYETWKLTSIQVDNENSFPNKQKISILTYLTWTLSRQRHKNSKSKVMQVLFDPKIVSLSKAYE